jgi:hypothetical protein
LEKKESPGAGRLWARERRAEAFAARQGFNLERRGFAKLDWFVAPIPPVIPDDSEGQM